MQHLHHAKLFIACCAMLFPGGISAANIAPLDFADTQYDFVTFADLDGWSADKQAQVFAGFRKSCEVILKRKETAAARPMENALRDVCPRALALPENTGDEAAKKFFETNFRPVRVSKLGETTGLLTGYYEPEVEGSLTLTKGFTVPLYRRPPELISKARLGKRVLRAGFPSTGGAGHRVNGKFVEYHDRAAIEDGALAGRGLEIVWLRDAADAFFIQIQGSARIRLPDGKLVRVNYAAHNGHTFTPIGRNLIATGIVPRDENSMETIRMFIAEMPEEGRELMRQNKAFTFFRIVDNLPPDSEAVGAQGLSLVKERSIAVDNKLHVYGTPFWIEAKLQLQNTKEGQPFNRLMIAQDTGSAIVGIARADIYFGGGADAGAIAGRIRNPGAFFMLVPNEIDPVRLAAAANIPNPDYRPEPEKKEPPKAEEQKKDAQKKVAPKPDAQKDAPKKDEPKK
ncbi:MAG: murein transglycosylase A [Xanthobacteraceae bacterium]|nr:murein transglycosylase A [Xanthobacteraceae bacterium]